MDPWLFLIRLIFEPISFQCIFSLKTKTLPLGKVFRQKRPLWVSPLWLGQNSGLHTYRNSWSPFTSQPHSSYTLLGCTRVYPCPCTVWPQPRISREPACRCPGTTLHISFFFFFLLHWPIYSTYYDPQTHFCLLNKIFNFVELHLHPFSLICTLR